MYSHFSAGTPLFRTMNHKNHAAAYDKPPLFVISVPGKQSVTSTPSGHPRIFPRHRFSPLPSSVCLLYQKRPSLDEETVNEVSIFRFRLYIKKPPCGGFSQQGYRLVISRKIGTIREKILITQGYTVFLDRNIMPRQIAVIIRQPLIADALEIVSRKLPSA